MKMRPQVNGPIDVGYGNYILTAPADRQGRKKKRKSEKEAEDGLVEKQEKENVQSNMLRNERKKKSFNDKKMPDGKYDVSDLLSSANTLTNPHVDKYKKSEL